VVLVVPVVPVLVEITLTCVAATVMAPLLPEKTRPPTVTDSPTVRADVPETPWYVVAVLVSTVTVVLPDTLNRPEGTVTVTVDPETLATVPVI
jgi:hypothetical protein